MILDLIVYIVIFGAGITTICLLDDNDPDKEEADE